MAPIAMKNVVPTKKSTPAPLFQAANPPTKRKTRDEPVENEPAKRKKIALDRETPLPVASPQATKRKAGDPPSQNEPAKRQKIRNTSRLLAKTPTSVKASTAAQGSPPALPNTAAATPALSTQASLASSTLSNSAISTTPPTPTSSPQQAGVSTTQATNTASPSTTFLSAPAYNPTACFNQAVPSPITPWPHNFPAPTPRFTRPLSSPVNWAKIPGLKREHIEAYELRAPWNPAPMTFEAVTREAQHVRGRVPSEECVRKRFKKACLAVFQCSGVYFEDTALGLEAYGVPKQKDLKSMIEAVTSTAGKRTTPSTKRPDHPPPIHHHETAIYTGDLITIQLQPPSDSPHARPSLRLCPTHLLPNAHILNTYTVMVADDQEIHIVGLTPTLPFSPTAFDHWLACVAFGPRRSFPARTYECREVADGQYMVRDNGRSGAPTLRLLLETYCVSRLLRTRAASAMIRRKILEKFEEGVGERDKEMLRGWLGDEDSMLDAAREVLGEEVLVGLGLTL